jgi:uncharacterized protein
MIPSAAQIEEVHRRYAQNEYVFELVYTHCKIVTEIALWCANNSKLRIDLELLEAASMLHDIGTYALLDKKGRDDNRHNYKQHAIFGAALADEEGFDPRISEIIKTHLLLGLSRQEIIDAKEGMPQNDYLPMSIEAEILCYADRFHSKRPCFNDYASFLKGLSQDLPIQAQKFKDAAKKFGLPDIEALSKKYSHPIKY